MLVFPEPLTRYPPSRGVGCPIVSVSMLPSPYNSFPTCRTSSSSQVDCISKISGMETQRCDVTHILQQRHRRHYCHRLLRTASPSSSSTPDWRATLQSTPVRDSGSGSILLPAPDSSQVRILPPAAGRSILPAAVRKARPGSHPVPVVLVGSIPSAGPVGSSCAAVGCRGLVIVGDIRLVGMRLVVVGDRCTRAARRLFLTFWRMNRVVSWLGYAGRCGQLRDAGTRVICVDCSDGSAVGTTSLAMARAWWNLWFRT